MGIKSIMSKAMHIIKSVLSWFLDMFTTVIKSVLSNPLQWVILIVLLILLSRWDYLSRNLREMVGSHISFFATPEQDFLAFCEKGKVAEVEKVLAEKRTYVDAKNAKGQTVLMISVEANQPAVVDALLKFHPNVDARDDDGRTALFFACKNGNLKIVERLLAYGADFKQGDHAEDTPLMTAAGEGHAEVVKTLLKKGADPNAENEHDWTALMYAAERDRLEIADILLKAGAKVNAETDDGWTALNLACRGSDDPKLIELLVDHKADIEQENDDDYTPLMTAANEGHTEAVRVLLEKGADIEKLTPELRYNSFRGNEGFFALCEQGKVDEVEKTLVEKRADVNARNAKGQTALMLAVIKNQPLLVDRLLNFHPDLQAQDENGMTALMYAAANDRIEIAEYLLARGADVEISLGYHDKEGNTALHLACRDNDDPRMVELLLSIKLNALYINRGQYNDVEQTPLILATIAGHVEVVKALLKGDADPNAENENDQTALMYAASRDRLEIADILLKTGAKVNAEDDNDYTALHLACRENDDPKMVELLIRHGADIEQENDKGNTPLMIAATWRRGKVVKTLLKAGADTETKNSEVSGTALFGAAQCGWADVIRVLLDAGANVHAKMDGDVTALHVAAVGVNANVVELLKKGGVDVSARDNAAVAELLIKRGIDVNARDDDDVTPIMYAAHYGAHTNVIDTLIKHDVDLKALDEDDHDVLWHLLQNDKMPAEEKKRCHDKILKLTRK